jgi:hypothetical protein
MQVWILRFQSLKGVKQNAYAAVPENSPCCSYEMSVEREVELFPAKSFVERFESFLPNGVLQNMQRPVPSAGFNEFRQGPANAGHCIAISENPSVELLDRWKFGCKEIFKIVVKVEN